MSTMRKRCWSHWALAISLLLSSVESQAEENHLIPAESHFGDFLYRYHSKVRSILLKDFDDSAWACMVVLPSFRPERAVSLEKKEDKYFVIARVVSSSIWESEKPEELTVKIQSEEIDAQTAEKIQTVFFTAVSQSRYPAQDSTGLDGESYFFSAFKMQIGARTGRTWSPQDAGSIPGLLVQYGNLLMEYVECAPERRGKIHSRLNVDAETLVKRLKADS